MRILTRYILKEFLTPVIYCLIGFTLIYLVIDLFGKFDHIIAAKPSISLLAAYLIGYLSALLQWLCPASLLLGGLYSMWQLTRHSEITAMRASGVSFRSITKPMIWASVGFAVLVALNSEFFAPRAAQISKQISDNKFRPTELKKLFFDVSYNNVKASRYWRLRGFDPGRSKLRRPKVTLLDENGVPREVIEAYAADYIAGEWWFHDCTMTSYDTSLVPGTPEYQNSAKSVTQKLVVRSDFDETPNDFRLEQLQNIENRETLSVREMVSYLAARPRLPKEVRALWRYDIANRFTAPLACIVITLFALPAGIATGRQSVFVGVISAIGMFFAFYALSVICGGLAQKGVLPVLLGAIIPDCIFFVAGLTLFHRQR